MGEPGFWDNPEKAQETIHKIKPLNGLLKPYEELQANIGDLQALAELAGEDASLDGELDAELRAWRNRWAISRCSRCSAGRKTPATPTSASKPAPAAPKPAIGRKCLLRMYGRWAERHKYQAEIIDELRNDEAGIRSATLHVKGDFAYGRLQSEAGVHRLVRISPFDSNARRQTSFAAVDVMPEIEGTIEIEIKPDELKRDTFRSGGPGGQHQNKTESGVRYTHLPTGLACESRTERSQHKNDQQAMSLLKAKLYKIEEQKRRAEVDKLYDEKGEVAWGYQIRNYVLQPYTLSKDLRTGVETSQVHQVLDGDLDQFIEAFLRHKAKRDSQKGK